MTEDNKDDDAERQWVDRHNSPDLNLNDMGQNIPESLKRKLFESMSPGNPSLAKAAADVVSLGMSAILTGFRNGDFNSDKMCEVINTYVGLLKAVGPTFSRGVLFALAAHYGDLVRFYMMMHGMNPNDTQPTFSTEQIDDPSDPVVIMCGQLISAAIASHAQDMLAIISTNQDSDFLAEVFLTTLAQVAHVYRTKVPFGTFQMSEAIDIPDDASSLLDEE